MQEQVSLRTWQKNSQMQPLVIFRIWCSVFCGILHRTNNIRRKNLMLYINLCRLEKKWQYFFIQCSLISERALLFGRFFRCAPLYFFNRNLQTNMNIKHWWENIDKRKPKYSEKNLSQWHFVHHKSHTDWSRIEARPQRWLYLNHDTVLKTNINLHYVFIAYLRENTIWKL
jgi:hypothetical protein